MMSRPEGIQKRLWSHTDIVWSSSIMEREERFTRLIARPCPPYLRSLYDCIQTAEWHSKATPSNHAMFCHASGSLQQSGIDQRTGRWRHEILFFPPVDTADPSRELLLRPSFILGMMPRTMKGSLGPLLSAINPILGSQEWQWHWKRESWKENNADYNKRNKAYFMVRRTDMHSKSSFHHYDHIAE